METQARPPQALRSFLARFLAAVRNLSTHVSATAQLRPLDKFDTSQLQNASPSYGECRIVGLEKAPRPTHKARRPKRLWQYSNRSYRSYGTGSTGRTFRYKQAFFSYEESATAKFAPSTRAKLSPAQSPPRTSLRGPALSEVEGPGFPYQKPLQRPCHKCHTFQLQKRDFSYDRCDIVTSPTPPPSPSPSLPGCFCPALC